MPVPVFEFTDRAVPVVQIGQFQNAFSGRDRWGRGHWGVGHWGSPLGPAIWADVTCDVHEITTDTGRGSASDTFVPGTADLIASNLTGWGDGDTPIASTYFVDDFDRNGLDLDGFGGDLDYNWIAWPEMVMFRPDSEELVVASSRTLDLFESGSLLTMGGAAVPWPRPVDPGDSAGAHFGKGWALWALPHAGDQFVEVDMTGLGTPDVPGPAGNSTVELYAHLVAGSLEAQVAIIHWQPAWADPVDTGTLTWTIGRRNTTGTLTTLATGSVGYGAAGFLSVVRFRFEADADGSLLLLQDGRRLGDAVDPTPPAGDHIALYAELADGPPPPELGLIFGLPAGTPRIGQVTAGSNLPVPIFLEPGTLLRVGVTHAVQGLVWLFHGYVDGLVPVYDPVRTDTVRIECIDALGEVGRTTVLDSFVERTPPTPGNPGGGQQSLIIDAGDRVRRLLERADWPAQLRDLDEDSTLTQDTGNESRMLDLLTQTADSCAGAVYGGPSNGHVVFRHKDWQWFEPGTSPDAYITNQPPDPAEFAGPAVCPSGWERSWHRADMVTWVELTNVESFRWRQSNPTAVARYGREELSRQVVTFRPDDVKLLARRQLRLRGPVKFPRVEAVLFDAATSDDALDLMMSATFTRPHRYRCQLRSEGDWKFDREYLVTGVRHRIARDGWQCRLALDVAAPWAIHGGHWGRARWGRNDWGQYR